MYVNDLTGGLRKPSLQMPFHEESSKEFFADIVISNLIDFTLCSRIFEYADPQNAHGFVGNI